MWYVLSLTFFESYTPEVKPLCLLSALGSEKWKHHHISNVIFYNNFQSYDTTMFPSLKMYRNPSKNWMGTYQCTPK